VAILYGPIKMQGLRLPHAMKMNVLQQIKGNERSAGVSAAALASR
jgi:hypothetical protein